MRQGSFEKFYYTKVGLGEGCGCAERIIDNHEIERIRANLEHRRATGGGWISRSLRRFFSPKSASTSPKD